MYRKSIPQRRPNKVMTGEELLAKLAHHAAQQERKKDNESDEGELWKEERGERILRHKE